MKNSVQKLMGILEAIKTRPEYVQGGGGNVSVKLGLKTMAIKASGLRFSQITEERGLVEVDYAMIRNFYAGAVKKNLPTELDFLERASSVLAVSSFLRSRSNDALKPSMETGFHALLGKYVIHTHSVYVNIVCCSKVGEDLLKKIFPNAGRDHIFAQYAHPGFFLTLEIGNKIGQNGLSGRKPRVFFLKNHGLIVSGDTVEEAGILHEKINEEIKRHFDIVGDYPEIKIKSLNENKHVSGTKHLSDFLKGHADYFTDIKKRILFPDQTVFCDEVSIKGVGNDHIGKIEVDSRKGRITYRTNYAEALTIEEILNAWAFIITNQEKLNLEPVFLREKDTNYIRNMASEKYRKGMLK